MSCLEDDEEDSLPANLFYEIVNEERKQLAEKSGEGAFRWKNLAEKLATRHPYFETHTIEHVRQRFKYIKKQLK